MKAVFFLAIVLLLAVSAASAESSSMERLHALKTFTSSTVQSLSMDQNALELVKNLEKQLLRQVAEDKKNGAQARVLKCSPKLTWGGAKATLEKNVNKGEGVQKVEDWAPEGAKVATVYVEANASASAVLGLSAGVGIAFEFAVTWTGKVPSFADAAVSVCASADIAVGLSIGVSAGGTIYLVFGPIEYLDQANVAVGGELYAAIGGGIQVMLKAPATVVEVQTAWTEAKKGLAPTQATISAWGDKLKSIAKGTVNLAKATVIGVAFSAGVGAGVSVPFSASFSVADFIKNSIPAAFGDWAKSTAGSVQEGWKKLTTWKK